MDSNDDAARSGPSEDPLAATLVREVEAENWPAKVVAGKDPAAPDRSLLEA